MLTDSYSAYKFPEPPAQICTTIFHNLSLRFTYIQGNSETLSGIVLPPPPPFFTRNRVEKTFDKVFETQGGHSGLLYYVHISRAKSCRQIMVSTSI